MCEYGMLLLWVINNRGGASCWEQSYVLCSELHARLDTTDGINQTDSTWTVYTIMGTAWFTHIHSHDSLEEFCDVTGLHVWRVYRSPHYSRLIGAAINAELKCLDILQSSHPSVCQVQRFAESLQQEL